MTRAGRSSEGNYLTVFCLCDLIYDFCYELVVILEFGSISETGWGDVFNSASCRILKEKLSARSCHNSQMRRRVFRKRLLRRGSRSHPLSRECCQQSGVGRSQTQTTCPHEHISVFKRRHLFVPKVSSAPILAYTHGTYTGQNDLTRMWYGFQRNQALARPLSHLSWACLGR